MTDLRTTYTIHIQPYVIEQEGRWYPAIKTTINDNEPTYESTTWDYPTEVGALSAAHIWAAERVKMAKRSLDAALEHLKRTREGANDGNSPLA